MALTDRWTIGNLCREALKNTFGRSSRQYLLSAAAVVFGVLVVAQAEASSTNLRSDLISSQRTGRDMVIFGSPTGSEEFRIQRSSCERLLLVPGVERAGVVVGLGRSDVAQIGPLVPFVGASYSLVPELSAASAVVGVDLSGYTGGARLSAGRFGVLDAVLGPAIPEPIGVGAAVIVPLDPAIREAGQCIVQFDPLSDLPAMVDVARASLIVSGGAPSASLQSPSRTIADEFLARPERWLSALLGIAGAVMSMIFGRLRGSEFAAYRLSGTSSLSYAKLYMLEQSVHVFMFVGSGLLALFLVGNSLVSQRAVIGSLFVGAAIWLGVSAPASLVLALRSPTSAAKDR